MSHSPPPSSSPASDVADIADAALAREHSRMRWAARRGMLELDLVLEPYVLQRYPLLEEADRARFEQLMLCEDQELFGWLLQRGQPQDEALAMIVDDILRFTRTAPADR